MVIAVRPSSADLRSTRKRDAGLAVLDGFEVRLDFLGPELVGRAARWRRCSSVRSSGVKISFGRALFDQECAALGFG